MPTLGGGGSPRQADSESSDGMWTIGPWGSGGKTTPAKGEHYHYYFCN